MAALSETAARARDLAARAWAGVSPALPSFRDLHVYGGGALCAAGVGMVWLPGALVVMGALLLYLGLRRVH
jgi:hypothetical protein